MGWVGGQAHTCKINSRENSQRNNGHVKKIFMQLKNYPIPAITFLINGPPLIKATISAGLHVSISW